MGTIDTIKPLSTVLNLSNTKRKILGKSDNWTRGYWYWVRSKNATSVLCSPPRRSIFDTGQWLGSGNLPKKSAKLFFETGASGRCIFATKRSCRPQKFGLYYLLSWFSDLYRDLWFAMNDLFPRKLWASTVHFISTTNKSGKHYLKVAKVSWKRIAAVAPE